MQRGKTLKECPSCHRNTMRPGHNGTVDGRQVCDECVIDNLYKKRGH